MWTPFGRFIYWSKIHPHLKGGWGILFDIVLKAYHFLRKILACGDGNATIRLWQLENQELWKTLETKTCISAIAFSPDNRWLVATGGYSRVLILLLISLKGFMLIL